MEYLICSIFDSATESFGRPIFVAARGQAMRAFQDEINRKESGDLYNHSSDFILYHIGNFDDRNGRVQPGELTILSRGKDIAAIRDAKE